MKCFGLTILAKDSYSYYYRNYTVVAHTVEEALNIVIKYYSTTDDEFIDFDQTIQLKDVNNIEKPKIIEIQGKIYFE